MGLLLGASFISVFEMFELIFLVLRRRQRRRIMRNRSAAAAGNHNSSALPAAACLSRCRNQCEPPCQNNKEATEDSEVEVGYGGEVNVVVKESRSSTTDSGYNTAGDEAIG